jgi:penicillin-binding protein 1A
MSRNGAAIITNMLEAVITEGTGLSARNLPSPLAGKTGTTNDFKDALFVGYSPEYATGVWVGNDDATTLGPKESGAQAALPIWIQLMRKIGRQQTQSYFDIPDELRQISMNPRTGARMDTGASGSVRALVRR